MELTLDQALKKGIEAHKAGKAQEADRYYTAILKANPKHPDANHNMGVLAVGVGKVEEALPFFKTALEANSNIAQYWISYIDVLIKLDRNADAKAVLEQAKSQGAKGDGYDQVEFRLANIANSEGGQTDEEILEQAIDLRENGKYDEAIDLLLRQVKLSPTDPNILALLSHCYILKDNIEQAEIYLDTAKNINSSLASVGWSETRLLLKQKKIDEALTIAKTTNKLFPDDIEGMGVVGSCLRANGNFDESLKYLNKAIELNPNYAEALINRGLIFLNKKDKSNALTDLAKAHQLKPHIKQVWDLIIALYAEENRYEKAINCLVNMIEIDPSHPKSLTLLAQCNQKADDTRLAIMSFQKVLEVIQENAPMHVNLGIAMNKQGDHESAVEQFNKAIAIKPEYSEAYNNMGNALLKQGKPEEAIAAYTKAIAIKPEYSEAYTNLGNALVDQGKLEDAIEAYNKAIAIKPDYAEAYNNMGAVLQEQGKSEGAIEAYIKALSIKPDNVAAWDNLYFPLKATSFHKQSDQSISRLYPKDINSTYSEIQLNILDYKLSRGQESEAVYRDRAIKSLSDADNISIKNPTFDKNTQEKIQKSPNKMVALLQWGRSGTGLMHSLIDGHPEVSTLPSIYFSEYFNHSTWARITSNGWNGMVDQFIATYEVLFDATSSVPIEIKSGQVLYSIGISEGMANVGDQKNEVLRVDKGIFRAELKRLMACYDELDAIIFFKLVKMSYNEAIRDCNSKRLIFYHIHNPSSYAQLNFVRLNPNANFLLMVREPIQSCESWVRLKFVENDYFSVANRILIMLFDIDNSLFSRQNAVAVRLEDLKNKPRKTVPALCKWMGIKNRESLYEMTAQGKKWWGDPSSPDFKKDGNDPFGKTSIKRKVGSIFSHRDQFILRTLFYPFSVRFGYREENEEQFKVDLQKIRPMINEMFDFEVKIAEKVQMSSDKLMGSGSYLYFRSGLIERWNTLNKYQTYPNMINPLKIETDSIG